MTTENTIKVSCPGCKATGNTAASFAGRSLKCPKCGTAFIAGEEIMFFEAADTNDIPAEETSHPISDERVGIPPQLQNNTFSINWAEWPMGGRMIFIATSLAILSMFFKWVDMGFISFNGLSQATFFFLGGFAYPCMILLKGQQMDRTWGLVSSIGATVAVLIYIASKNVRFIGNVSAIGAHLFLLCSITLIIGVILYQQNYQQKR